MKNYVNKTVNANSIRGVDTITGKLCFFDDGYVFDAQSVNGVIRNPKIKYKSIAEIKPTNTLGIIPNGLTIQLKNGEVFKYVVFHRNDIIEFLSYKMNNGNKR